MCNEFYVLLDFDEWLLANYSLIIESSRLHLFVNNVVEINYMLYREKKTKKIQIVLKMIFIHLTLVSNLRTINTILIKNQI